MTEPMAIDLGDLGLLQEFAEQGGAALALDRISRQETSLLQIANFHLLESVICIKLGKPLEALHAAQRELQVSPNCQAARHLISFVLDVFSDNRTLHPYIDLLSPSALRSLFSREDPIIVDIGCERAGEVGSILRLFPQARIYCFDPDPRVFELFVYKEDPRVSFFPLAIGDADFETTMYLSAKEDPQTGRLTDMTGCSSICKPVLCEETWTWLKFPSTIQVQMMTLDTWAENHLPGSETIDLVWADVQGAERKLIEGRRQTLTNRTRFFYTEFINFEAYAEQPSLCEILSSLPNFEYVAEAEGGNVLLRNSGWSSPLPNLLR